MARSLSRQLMLWLVLPQLVLWLAGGAATYRLAAGYAIREVDASLSQASRALARQLKPLDNGLLIDFPRAAQDVLEADPDDRLMYTVSAPPGEFILGNHRVPPPPPGSPTALNTPFFYDGEMHTGADDGDGPLVRVRVAAFYRKFGGVGAPPQTMLVQVARSSASREGLARSILVDTLLPLSLLIGLMTAVVGAGIRAGLSPLTRLRREVAGRAPNDLAPIRLADAPRELHALVNALNALLAAVRSNVAVHQRFIADAAHQLRTPLAGLKGQTELALTATDDPAMLARLQRVHASAARSAHLVNQLLKLARAEPEAAISQDRTELELRRFVQSLVAEQVPPALRAGVDLGLDTTDAPHPLRVHANALLLREALLNLIDNAIRYAGRGAEVTLRVAEDGDQARIEVVDNGPGVPAEAREQVFERFVRLGQDPDGCGLGLAIVREIVGRHGGRVWVEDAEPRGARFVLSLPVSRGRG